MHVKVFAGAAHEAPCFFASLARRPLDILASRTDCGHSTAAHAFVESIAGAAHASTWRGLADTGSANAIGGYDVSLVGAAQ